MRWPLPCVLCGHLLKRESVATQHCYNESLASLVDLAEFLSQRSFDSPSSQFKFIKSIQVLIWWIKTALACEFRKIYQYTQACSYARTKLCSKNVHKCVSILDDWLFLWFQNKRQLLCYCITLDQNTFLSVQGETDCSPLLFSSSTAWRGCFRTAEANRMRGTV